MIAIMCDNCGHEYDIEDWDELEPNCELCFAEHIYETYRDEVLADGFQYVMLDE